MLENAIRAAVGLRGVAVVAIPGDIALDKAPQRAPSTARGLALSAPRIVTEAGELKALAAMLNGAERVTLFCGRGCAGAHGALMQLAESCALRACVHERTSRARLGSRKTSIGEST